MPVSDEPEAACASRSPYSRTCFWDAASQAVLFARVVESTPRC